MMLEFWKDVFYKSKAFGALLTQTSQKHSIVFVMIW